MSRDHDEIDQLPASPDALASPDEEARAASFAELVDQLVAGRAQPSIMDLDERELLDTAAIMRANLLPSQGIAPARMTALIDDVLVSAHRAKVEERVVNETRSTEPAPESGHNDDGVIDLADRRAARRRKLTRMMPWGIAAVAAAAALMFALRTPGPADRGPADIRQPVKTELSMMHRSRPADPLIGRIPPTRADRASDRMDIIYADRMAGYRDLKLRGDRP